MRRRIGSNILVVAVALGLCACTPEAPEQMTLSGTKSPVQLLRNESVFRLPSDDVGSVVSTDTSVGCGDDETVRQWKSTAEITLTGASSQDPDAAIATLAASFEEDGWVISPGNERLDEKQAVMTSGTSAAEIRLIAHPAEGDEAASVTVEAAGPCVQTDGPDSDEVTMLEDID